MPEYTSQLTPAIRAHLNGLIRTSGLPETQESLEQMARAWFQKKAMFEGQVKALNMRELERFSADDARGALLLTWSGSLLSAGPRKADAGGRAMEYASIDMRIDVPHLARSDRGDLEADIAPGEIARLRGGPIAHTSPLLSIVACDPSIAPEEQEKRIREATIFLTNGFIQINRTVVRPGRDFPEQLTMKSMVTYLARKNELSQKQTRQLLDDYLIMLESGLLLGLKVPIGKMGRLSLKRRAARRARLGINPATGEKITLNARPAELAPKMTFSRVLKDRARTTPLTEG
jgi:nucleoid DNA-binding protein